MFIKSIICSFIVLSFGAVAWAESSSNNGNNGNHYGQYKDKKDKETCSTTVHNVPDAGSTLALMGMGITVLGGLGWKFKM